MSVARPPDSNVTSREPRPSAELGCLIQLFWSIGGSGVLTALAVLIVREPPWSFSLRDAFYWAVVAAMIAARALDVRRFGGRTEGGDAATVKDVRRYATGLVVIAAVVWAAAQSLHFGPRS